MDARNVVLVGRSGAGKTALVSALAGRAPAADEATTGLTLTAVEHRGTRLTLLDTPGDPELQGALRAGLRGADAVLFVVPTVGGLDPFTAMVWAETELLGRPRIVALTQLDAPGSDVDEAVALCQRLLDEDVLPLALPMHDDDGVVAGLLTLLDLTVVEAAGRRPADPEHRTLVAGVRGDLVEAILADSEDDALVQDWLEDREPDPGRLEAALHAAVRRGGFAPAVVVGARSGVGVPELLDLLVTALPGPGESPCPDVAHTDGSPAAPLEADAAGPAVLEVLRGGNPALVRVWSGPGAGTVQERDEDLQTGRVLADGLVLAPWPLPEPGHAVGVDGDLQALRARVSQDPTLRLSPDADTGQLLLWSLGARHAARTLHGLAVTAAPVVPARRTHAGVLQERWDDVAVTVPTAYLRTVVSDLTGRGARVAPVAAPDEETVTVHGALAASALVDYPAALAALTGGTGYLARRPGGWEPVA